MKRSELAVIIQCFLKCMNYIFQKMKILLNDNMAILMIINNTGIINL